MGMRVRQNGHLPCDGQRVHEGSAPVGRQAVMKSQHNSFCCCFFVVVVVVVVVKLISYSFKKN